LSLLISRTLNNNGMIFLRIYVEHAKKGMGSMIIGRSRVDNEKKTP